MSINNELYPKQESQIQYGIRRVPLHYLPKELGGNGILQHNIIYLCEIQKIYNVHKNDWDAEKIIEYHEQFTGYKHYLLTREQDIFVTFLDLLDKEPINNKDEIHKNLADWYGNLLDIVNDLNIEIPDEIKAVTTDLIYADMLDRTNNELSIL